MVHSSAFDPIDLDAIEMTPASQTRLMQALQGSHGESLAISLDTLVGLTRTGGRVRIREEEDPQSFSWTWFLPGGSIGMLGMLTLHGPRQSAEFPRPYHITREEGWTLHS
jgi:hypothetical protein